MCKEMPIIPTRPERNKQKKMEGGGEAQGVADQKKLIRRSSTISTFGSFFSDTLSFPSSSTASKSARSRGKNRGQFLTT
jgi:hypothetical protein